MAKFKQTLLILISTVVILILIVLIFYYQGTDNSSQLPVKFPHSNLPTSNQINNKTIIDENIPKTQAQQTKYNEALKRYEIDLQNWKNQCYFKPGIHYGHDIRNKLGTSKQYLYSNDKIYIDQITSYNTIPLSRSFSNKLLYNYSPDWLINQWYFDYALIGQNHFAGNIKLDIKNYLDTTPPPTKPTLESFKT